MKFSSPLTESTLLKRTLKFLVEVALTNRQRLMIRCPNLGQLMGCDILGTKIWYSNAVGYHCLPTWELAEVDNGHLVCINPEMLKPLVIEALKDNVIDELKEYHILHTGMSCESQRFCHILLEKEDEQCFVALEHVTLGDDRGEGYFPDSAGIGHMNLDQLIRMKEEGHRAVLLYCVLHTGIESVKPAAHIDADYVNKLREAVEVGVELIAYRATISLQDIDISSSLPVVFSKDAVSR